MHLHTPASVDYREKNVTYLDFLKKADERGLDVIAFTDHNTVKGYERYLEEVESLELLERRNRLTDEEREQLADYRILQDKLLILPGFELTATLGFHILGVFPPETTVRELEHLLLDLNVPADKLDLGSGEVGATIDVLTAYRLINEAGGMVIAAHANSSHGVAMPGFDFGGQTRISYTQDPNLHALEVTDLASRSRRRTALFFSGTKPEYPRRMQLLQGSDAHRITGIPGNHQEFGVGDRASEMLLDEVSFNAILNVLKGKDFSRIRPYVPASPQEFDPIREAREEGETLVQAFHESVGRGNAVDRHILQDAAALANTNGGTIFVGVSAHMRSPVQGVARPVETIHQLKSEIARHIVPPLDVQIDTLKSGGKNILQIIVPRGSEVPYAVDGTQIYIRSENETGLAVRDEIVNLVRDSLAVEFAAQRDTPPAQEEGAQETTPLATVSATETTAPPVMSAPPPQTGVEIFVGKPRSRGDAQYSMRDLRNNRTIHNVTRSSARKLWQYAISEYESHPISQATINWSGNLGILNTQKRAGKLRYDLVQRDSNGELHVYYGVTEDGIDGPWKELTDKLGAEPSQVAESEELNSSAPRVFELGAESEQAEDKQPNEMQPDFIQTEPAATGLGIDREITVTADATKLMFPPGRDLLPPVRVNLLTAEEPEDIPVESPSTTVLEVAEVPAEIGIAPTAVTAVEAPILPPPAAAELQPVLPGPSIQGPFLDAPLVPKNPLVAVPADDQLVLPSPATLTEVRNRIGNSGRESA